jgi:hypothetical protein
MKKRGERLLGILGALIVSGCAAASMSPLPGTTAPPSGSGLPSTEVYASGTPAQTPPLSPTDQSTPAPGTIVPAAALLQTPDGVGSLLLSDGRVLVSGTWSTDGQAAGTPTGELYDPSTGKWSMVTTASDAFGYPIDVSLGDGRVLMADERDSALFNPSGGGLVEAGPMVVDGGSDTATPLMDGRVLLAGGIGTSTSGGNPPYLASAQLYDPATNRFVKTGSMKVARESAVAVRLHDGRVLIAGGDQGLCGECGEANYLSSAELYDPSTGTFAPTGSMHLARTEFAAVLLADGQVLVAGGASGTGDGNTNSVEIYEPPTGHFSACGYMTTPRLRQLHLIALANGKVLIAGGNVDNGNSAEIFDPATCTSTSLGEIPYGLGSLSVGLANGRVLFPGTPSGIYWP